MPVELPDLKGREEILKVHAKKVRLGDDIDFNAIARAASGASGAELANMVNEAALRAVRENRKFVTQADLEESIETVIAGYQKKNQVLSAKEKLIVSYHEIGHALVAALQTHSAPVMKNLVLKISKLMWNLKQFLMHLMHGQTLRTSVISTWTTWIKLIFPTIRPQSGKEGFLSRLLFSRN